MKNQSYVVRWLLLMFATLIVVVNATLSFAFGYDYLGPAFGISGWLSPVIGGVYAVLVADVAFLVWFWVYRRLAETLVQRSISMVIGVMALVLSVAMSVNQLAVNSYNLVDLSDYHRGVGLIALTIIIGITAAHIISLCAFELFDQEERSRSTKIQIQARLMEESIQTAEAQLDDVRSAIVQTIQGEIRRGVLADLGMLEERRPAPNGAARFQQQTRPARIETAE